MPRNYRALQAELQARPDHDQRAAAAKATLRAQDDAYFRRLSELRHARRMTQVFSELEMILWCRAGLRSFA